MDSLIYWGTVEPVGASGLAALRFSQAVRVRSIRLFPKDAQPFEQEPGLCSETQPNSFQLHIYFNSQPTPRDDSEPKQKPSNALVSTTMVYTGRAVDCSVDMSEDWATRLLILRGDFEKLSLAIYGTTVSDAQTGSTPYEPQPLPATQSAPLAPALNPAAEADPAALAVSLLGLVPDAPPLPLVVRLSWCLKPPDEDWDNPEFPYIYPDLDEQGEFDAEVAAQITKKAVADDTACEALERFVGRVVDSLGPASDDQAYDVADLLSNVASQHPDFARIFSERLDFSLIFDPSVVKEDTHKRLLAAAANPDIARALLASRVGDGLQHDHGPHLLQRLQGWNVLSDALWNTQADFSAARAFLQSIGSDQPALGAVLHALIANEELRERLSENPVEADVPVNADSDREFSSHDEFVAYLRAWIGVASVVTVFSWADSLDGADGEEALERFAAIVYLWQGCPGYREIVHNLMMSKQIMWRFECRIVSEDGARIMPATTLDTYLERIVLELSHSPSSYLSEFFVKTVRHLPPGCFVIDEDERAALQDLGNLAHGGLESALRRLSLPLDSPVQAHDLLALRVANAMLAKELDGDDELRALRVIWDKGGQGILMHLVDIIVVLAADTRQYFSLAIPSSSSSEHFSQLLRSTAEILRLLRRLVPISFLPGRAVNALMVAISDLFACSDSTDLRFEHSSDDSAARQHIRRACIDVARLLVNDRTSPDNARTVFQSLLRHAQSPGKHEPKHHVGQIFALIDNLLPMPRQEAMVVDEEESFSNWLAPILPLVAGDLAAFVRLLGPDDRGHLLQRLADIDEGVVGIGEWLALAELKHLAASAAGARTEKNAVTAQLLLFESAVSMKFLNILFNSRSPSALRLVAYMTQEDEPASMLVAALDNLLAGRFFSPFLFEVVQSIQDSAAASSHTYPGLHFSIALVHLRALQHADESASSPMPLLAVLDSTVSALQSVATKSIEPGRLCEHFRDALLALAAMPSFTESQADAAASILEWLVKQSHAGLPQLSTLHGISKETATRLYGRISAALPSNLVKVMADVQDALVTPSLEDADVQPSVTLPSPDSLHLSLGELDDAFRAHIPPPCTPKRTTPPQAQSMLSLVTVSPPTALLRSPAVTGLTKTYNANDFRVLRQTPNARQNTNRMPSTHVDDYEMSSPTTATTGLPAAPYGEMMGFPGLATPYTGV